MVPRSSAHHAAARVLTYGILWAVPTAGWWRMRAVRPIAAGLAAAVALGLGLRGYMNSTTQDRLLPGEKAEIAELRSPLPQPGFLVCPLGYCRAGEAMTSPIFEMSWLRLREVWRRMIAAEPRTILVAEDVRRG